MPAPRKPARRHPSRRKPQVGRKLKFLRAAALAIAAVAALLAWSWLDLHFAPQPTAAAAGPVDALIVLGSPADSDGNPKPAMQDRVNEAVAEYERGTANRIVFSGGAAHNRFVEADVMARAAIAQGVPPSAIYRDRASRDTIQNLCNSLALARSNGWRSVEVISGPAHLPRVRLLLASSDFSGDLRWRTHPAPEINTPAYYQALAPAYELLSTAHYLLWSRWTESCPALTN